MDESNPPGSTNPSPPPMYSPSPQTPVPAPAPAKKSPLPWILAGCGCLCVLGVLLVIIGSLVFYRMAGDKLELENLDPYQVSPAPGDDLPTPPSAPALPPPPSLPTVPLASVPADWTPYVNDIAAIPPGLREHFLDFSFSYPPQFQVVPGESNFIKVEESVVDPDGGSYTLENFAVGYITADPEVFAGSDRELIFPMLAGQLSSQFAQGFPNYKEVSQGPAEVAGVPGLVMLFEAELTDTARGNIKIFGKMLLARQPGKEKGVAIIMLASTLDPEVTSPAEVGVKGDLAPILGSFRFGE